MGAGVAAQAAALQPDAVPPQQGDSGRVLKPHADASQQFQDVRSFMHKKHTESEFMDVVEFVRLIGGGPHEQYRVRFLFNSLFFRVLPKVFAQGFFLCNRTGSRKGKPPKARSSKPKVLFCT